MPLEQGHAPYWDYGRQDWHPWITRRASRRQHASYRRIKVFLLIGARKKREATWFILTVLLYFLAFFCSCFFLTFNCPDTVLWPNSSLDLSDFLSYPWHSENSFILDTSTSVDFLLWHYIIQCTVYPFCFRPLW